MMEILLTDLTDEIQIIDAKPLLYLKDIKAIIIADLHLGTEAIMSEDGTSPPFNQTEKLTEEILFYMNKLNPDILILNGDIKHSFQEFTKIENRDVKKFLKSLSPFVKKIHVIKGNHDLFLNWVIKEVLNTSLHEEHLVIGHYLFIHGDKKLPEKIPEEVKYVIIGHEHPVFSVRIKGLTKVKTPVFLLGPFKNREKNLIVLPAYSNYASGTPVNPFFTDNLLSPILKEDIELLDFESFVLNQDEVLHFPAFRFWFSEGRRK